MNVCNKIKIFPVIFNYPGKKLLLTMSKSFINTGIFKLVKWLSCKFGPT